ncbi:MAG: M50 family metallopeptidase [Clostridia bacterium]|nr:M50 family metallopeptidase [Clostridia bacterium]
MIFTGLGYILLAILVFGVLIFIHEFGHFITARIFGVKVKEFSIGMGPKIYSKISGKSGTVYSLRALPVGGFVDMEGENEDSEDENSFRNKAVWKRMIITAAGAAMNLLLGIVIMFALVFSSRPLVSTVISGFADGAVSSEAGLMIGDRVVKVENVSVHTGNELHYEIINQGYRPLDITVIRDGKRVEIEDISFLSSVQSGVTFGLRDFNMATEPANFPNLLKHAFWRSVSTVKMVIDSIADLIGGRYGIEAISGPVGTTTVIGDAAKAGGVDFLFVIVVITMNLGVMNLVPFPALDGGRMVFLLIELVFRKKVKPEIEGFINFAGLLLLFAFMIFITFKDIMGLI